MSPCDSAACTEAHRRLGREHTSCMDYATLLEALSHLERDRSMDFEPDASEAFTKQVAVELSVRLANKWAEQGTQFTAIREGDFQDLTVSETDALGWYILSGFQEYHSWEVMEATRPVLAQFYNDNGIDPETTLHGEPEFESHLRKEASFLYVRFEEAQGCNMGPWLEDLQAKYRLEADRSTSTASSDGDDLASEVPSEGGDTSSESSGEHYDTSSDSSGEYFDALSSFSQDDPSSPADSAVEPEPCQQSWQTFIKDLAPTLQRRPAPINEDLIKRVPTAAQRRAAELARLDNDDSLVCHSIQCPSAGIFHAKTWRCVGLPLALQRHCMGERSGERNAGSAAYDVGAEIPRLTESARAWAHSVMPQYTASLAELQSPATSREQAKDDTTSVGSCPESGHTRQTFTGVVERLNTPGETTKAESHAQEESSKVRRQCTEAARRRIGERSVAAGCVNNAPPG